MTSDLIHDRGRGPEIRGTRITVYNLLQNFLDPGMTEAGIARLYDLTPEQVAAARAYVLNNPDTVLAKHLDLEARAAAGNPPEVIEQAERARAAFQSFKEWLAGREEDSPAGADPAGGPDGPRLPTFREWLAEREAQVGKGS